MKESIADLLRQRPDAVTAYIVGFGLLVALAILNSDLPSGVALGGWLATTLCFAYPIATS